MITLFNVVSADGFIAREDGSEDFISDDLWPGFLDVCNGYDAIVMGRKTYEAIQGYDQELIDSFENLTIKKLVLTNNKDFKVKEGYTISHSPEEVVNISPNVLVTSGPTLNNYLLSKGLVNKIILHRLAVSIGEGIKPFDSLNGVEVEEHQITV
ncbi:MAG: hypothetical protein AAB638_03110 [Patescibacteria group bacterium]